MTADQLTQTYEPNPALRMLYRWFFDNIQVDEGWVREVRALSARGTVVYVLRSLNFVDFLALDHLTKRYDLPQVRFANDLRLGVLNPMGRGLLRNLLPERDITATEQLRDALSNGGSAALFLKRPPGVIDVASGHSRGRGMREGDELVRTLIDLQRERQTPILLVPQVFVWTNRPDTHGAHWLDFALGPREWPSPLRTVGQFLYNYKHVQLKAGEALDLKAHLEAAGPSSEDTQVRRIIYAMMRRLERERRIVTGPAQKPPDRQRHQILRSPKLQATIKQMAGERHDDRRALTRRTLNMLRGMQATPDTATIKFLEVTLDRVFHSVYAGIDVDREGIERLKQLSKDGSLVLLPSHKSHVDYLVLSFIFHEEGLQLPMIAAGDNLSFFPLGPVLRRAGGFFIRRSFRGDKLYSAAVEAYVRRLMRDGHSLELFLEGGRSRTGKLLTPKYGLLAMLVDAALSLPTRPVYWIPISIGYERIIEGGAYEHELSGGEKQQEDAAGLLKSTEILRHRYGRVNVQFGPELTFQGLREDLGIAPDVSLTPAKRRGLVTRLANRTMDEINRVTAVTPGALTALALLSDNRRSVAHDALIDRCRKLTGLLHSMGARITSATAVDGVLRPESIREAAQMFVNADVIEAHRPGDSLLPTERRDNRTGAGVVYRIPERKRLEMDNSKNIIVHFFVERALVAYAVLYASGPPVEVTAVRDRVLRLSKLFKHEFRFRADAGFDEIFEETLDAMIARDELQRQPDGTLTLGTGRDGWTAYVWLRTYRAILRNFLEGYQVAARGLSALLRGPLAEKEMVKKTLATGSRMFLGGDIELRESVSKPVIQNALTAFREEGYITLREGRYALAESFQNVEAVAAIEGRIVGYLETPAPAATAAR